jgi:hypothetical protein
MADSAQIVLENFIVVTVIGFALIYTFWGVWR